MVCLQFNCDEVVSLIQKLCENIGAMGQRHDKASVTWIGTFLQMRAKELEDKVAELWLGHRGLGLPRAPRLEGHAKAPRHSRRRLPQTLGCTEEEEVEL